MKRKCLVGIIFIVVLASQTVFANEQLFNPETWMTDLSVSIRPDTRLTRMALPGTHDTGTYGIDSRSPKAKDKQFPSDLADEMKKDGKIVEDVGIAVAAIAPLLVWNPVLQAAVIALGVTMAEAGKWIKEETLLYDVVAGWAHTQENDLVTQFKSGVRYFDLRVEYTGEDYRFVHALRNMKTTVSDALTALADTLKQPDNVMEIVVLDFNHLYENNGDMSVTAAKNLIDQHILPTFKYSDGTSMLALDDTDLSLINMWSSKKQVVLFFPGYTIYETMLSTYDTIFWRTADQIISHWPNKQHEEDLYNYLYDDLETSLMRSKQCFFVTQCLLTENSDMIHDGIYHLIYDEIGHAGMDTLDAIKHFSKKVRHFYDDLENNKHAPEDNSQMENALNQHVRTWYNEQTTLQFYFLSNIFIVDQFHSFPPVVKPWTPEATILAWNMNIDRYPKAETMFLSTGSVLPVDAWELGLDEFEEMPQIFFKARKSLPESAFMEFPVVLAPGDQFPTSRVYAVWNDEIPIRAYDFSLDQRSSIAAYCSGDPIRPFGIAEAKMNYQSVTQSLEMEPLPMLSPPRIKGIKYNDLLGSVTIDGQYFGAGVNVLVEYAVRDKEGNILYRYKPCGIDPEASFPYADAYNRPMHSCMKIWDGITGQQRADAKVGDSEVMVLWEPHAVDGVFTGYFLVDNQIGVDAIKIENREPVASDDFKAAFVNQQIVIDVLRNDADENGDRLKVVELSEPDHGSVHIQEGSFSNVIYQPDVDFFGNDAFTYTITDGYGGLSSAKVEVFILGASL